MVTKDWSKAAATAKRLIEKYGRTITIYKKSETPLDPEMPWLGPEDNVTDDDTTTLVQEADSTDILLENFESIFTEASAAENPADTASLNVKAVFVQADNDFAFGETFRDLLGDTIRRGTTRFIIYSEVDLRKFTEIKDGDDIWHINFVRMLKPGNTVILYDIEVKT